MPSGAPKIRRIRRELRKSIFGPGMFADWILHAPVNSPTVSHSLNKDCRDPNAVYVGRGSCMTTLSPWSCPLQPDEFDIIKLRIYVALRADCDVWIMRLTGKVLVCNCGRQPEECWAELLKSEFEARFKDQVDTEESRTFEVDEEDMDDEDDDINV